MQFFNSMSRGKEAFAPIEQNHVRMYTCGPTVYNFAHIGNFRAYTFEDILRRVLIFNNNRVTQVMNLTDVDDKTIRGAMAAGVPLKDFTAPFVQAFFDDLKVLNIQPAELYPAATDHIPEMIALVQRLFDKGLAYKSDDGSVYFSVAKLPGYGKLAHLDPETLRVGERVATLSTLSADRILVATDAGETAIMLTEDLPMHRCPRLWFQCPSWRKRCRTHLLTRAAVSSVSGSGVFSPARAMA